MKRLTPTEIENAFDDLDAIGHKTTILLQMLEITGASKWPAGLHEAVGEIDRQISRALTLVRQMEWRQ